MALWSQAQILPDHVFQNIRNMYRNRFPIEVRHCLSQWIENRLSPAHNMDETQATFVEEMVQEIDAVASRMDDFVNKMKLSEAAKHIQELYGRAPHDLYAFLHRCLATELEYIQHGVGAMNYQPEIKYGELINDLKQVRQSFDLANEELRQLEANTERFSLCFHEAVKNKGHLTFLETSMEPEKRDLVQRLRYQIKCNENTINALMHQIKQAEHVLVDRIKNNIMQLRQLQHQVLEVQLINWKREQQLSGNGQPMQSNLNTIQEWCENLADLIWHTRQQLINIGRISCKSNAELKQPHLSQIVDDLSREVTSLLSTLVTSTFVIEKQPPQVMKTNTRFTATVRLLVGGQLNVYMTPPRVTVSIISEQRAQMLLKLDPSNRSKELKDGVCGDIINNTGNMEYQPATKQLSVSFRNMQLRKVKRAEKKGTESVTDEKLTLFFQSDFKIGSGELRFDVWTLSLPVVVIVHGNQEPHGLATITWDNAFSEMGRVPFVVPDKVPWVKLAEVLCIKWQAATGGGLTAENLIFLAQKIFKTNLINTPLEAINAMPVSWTQFGKDMLPERNFSFWEWFYNVVKVTRDNLRTLWCDNLIRGFIQKRTAEEILSVCAPGTFLLRFSDSELGGITIAWVGENQEVLSLQPFTSRDLVLRSLADRILDLGQLQFLYPDIPKNSKFAKYYSKPDNEVQHNGYVKPLLKTCLPQSSSAASTLGSGAGGPLYAHSPDSERNTPSVQSSGQPTMMQL